MFFTSGVFWFIEGVVASVVIIAFHYWMQDRGIKMTWWKWLITAAWFLLAGFTPAFVGVSLGEGEPHAALLGGIIFGCLTIVGAVAVWRIIHGKR